MRTSMGWHLCPNPTGLHVLTRTLPHQTAPGFIRRIDQTVGVLDQNVRREIQV
jgi:hypothetical protein